MSFQLDRYDAARDLDQVTLLWRETLGQLWPLSKQALRNVTTAWLPEQRHEHLVAQADGRMVGFVATQINQNQNAPLSGNMMALIVHPNWQRQGIGKSLHDRAMDHLRKAGVKRVQIGGKHPRVWPGVPLNLESSLGFFKRQGWNFQYITNDLVYALDTFTLPDDLRARMAAERLTIEPATPADVEPLIAMQKREFAAWVDTYLYAISTGDFHDILVARDPKKGIVGSLIMCSPQAHPDRVDVLWKSLLGENAGSMGEVGVAASERKRGIGLALVGFGAELLKARGVHNCYISWTSLVDFYGKLGWKVWQQYHIANQDL